MKRSKKVLSLFLALVMSFSVLPFASFNAKADALSNAKDAYLSKITDMKNNHTVYTNMLPAYLAYVNACEDGAGSEEAAALQTAVNNMDTFTSKTYTNVSKVVTAESGYYSNVVYSDNKDNLQYSSFAHGNINQKSGLLIYNDDVFVYYPSAVLLYDGKTAAKIPVMFTEQTNNDNWGFRYNFVSEAGGHLTNNYWKGYDTVARSGNSYNPYVNAEWPSTSNNKISIDSSSRTYEFDSADGDYHSSKSEFFNFKNALTFEINDSDVFKKFSKLEFNVGAYWHNSFTGTDHQAEGDTSLSLYNPVYVLNYKKLLDKMEAFISSSAGQGFLDRSSTAFQKAFDGGDSTGMFACFDNATSLEFNDSEYKFSTDMEAGFVKAYTKLDNTINDFDEIKSTNGSFTALVKCIQDYEAAMKSNPYRKNLADAYRLYLQAKEAYDAYMFGQKNDSEDDATFLAGLETLAADFRNAINAMNEFANATYNESTDTYTYTAKAITGNYKPAEGVKYFENDSVDGTNAYDKYFNTRTRTINGAARYEISASNVLYFPTVYWSTPVGNYVFENSKTPSSSPKGQDNLHSNFRLYYPSNLVLLYNGETDTKFPIMTTSYNKHSGLTFDAETYSYWLYPTDTAAMSNVIYTENSDGISSYINNRTYETYNYPDSSKFGIAEGYIYDSEHSTSRTKGWAGAELNKEAYLDYFAFRDYTVGSTSSKGGIAGSYDTYQDSGDFNLKTGRQKKYSTAASASVEYKDNYFLENPNSKATDYDHINWSMIWKENKAWRSTVVTAESAINVLNVVPAMEAQQELVDNKNYQQILRHIFEYDNDSADMLTFLTHIDSIGSFDPNDSKYQYYKLNSTKGDYSYNQGVEDCCKDMDSFVANIDTAVADIKTGSSVADSSKTDGKVNVPTASEAEKESTSTETDPAKLDNGSWYNNLRIALIDPLEADGCTDTSSTYYTAYETALENAQNFISAKALNHTTEDFPEEYNEKTVTQIVEALNAAAADFDKSNTNHTYYYADENENQVSEWACQSNAVHTHSSADMSAYNELNIAYNTIDAEAYKNFNETVGTVYDDGNSENDNTSFVEVKTKAVRQKPQDFVDTEVADLLTAINEAAGEGSAESTKNSYQIHFSVSVDGADAEPVATYDCDYGDVKQLDALQYASFPEGGVCHKWTVSQVQGKEGETVYNRSNTLINFLQKECWITAYVNTPSPEGKTKIVINGPTNALINEVYAGDDDNITFSALTNGKIDVTINGKTYSVSSTTSYSVTGIVINGSDVENYAGQSVKVSDILALTGQKSILIKPTKTKNESAAAKTYTVSAFGTKNTTGRVYKNNATEGEVTMQGVQYDEKLRIEYDNSKNDSLGDFYGIVVNISEATGSTIPRYVPITYSNVYYFRAVRGMNFYPLYCKTVEEDGVSSQIYTVDDGNDTVVTNRNDKYYLHRHLPFVINFMDKDNVSGKFVFRVSFTAGLPDDVKITEHGWAYYYLRNNDTTAFNNALNALMPSEEKVKIDNTWSETYDGQTYTAKITKQAASKSYDPESHQFSFSSNNRTSGNAFLLARGYVKFSYTFSQTITDNGVEKTVTAPIEAISYGNADYYQYPSQNS